MTNLIGQDSKEAHHLLLRARVQIILDMEVLQHILFKFIASSNPMVDSFVSLHFTNRCIMATIVPLTIASFHVPFPRYFKSAF